MRTVMDRNAGSGQRLSGIFYANRSGLVHTGTSAPPRPHYATLSPAAAQQSSGAATPAQAS